MRKRISSVTNQRARRLLELMVEHGEVTTQELTELYGYNHPPAREEGRDGPRVPNSLAHSAIERWDTQHLGVQS
jgi:hypothetical protein